MDVDFATAEIRDRIMSSLRRGEVSAKVIECLSVTNGGLVPHESDLWDYKSALPSLDDAYQAAELVKDLVSFHNSLGGYLIFGVAEKHDDGANQSVAGLPQGNLDTERLRNLIRTYVGDLIKATFGFVLVNGHRLGVLHIPQRKLELSPVRFQRNSPESSKGKYIFRAGEVYFRFGDECRPAKEPQDWQFLYKERGLYSSDNGLVGQRQAQGPLYHNLPSRAVICPQFVGRDEILTRLWEWIGDEFQYARALAGESYRQIWCTRG